MAEPAGGSIPDPLLNGLAREYLSRLARFALIEFPHPWSGSGSGSAAQPTDKRTPEQSNG